MRRYRPYAVAINGTAVTVLTAQSGSLNSTIGNAAHSGNIYARELSITSQAPTWSFTTKSIGPGLTLLCPTNLPFLALSSTGLVATFGQTASGGAYASGSVHRSFSALTGIVTLQTLSAQQGQDATLSALATIAYDGTHDPVTNLDNVALPTVADAGRWTLAGVEIGDVVLTGVTGVDINFGVTVESMRGNDDIWPTHVCVMSVKPMMTISGLDLQWAKESGGIPLAGKAAAHTDTIVYLRKRAAGGSLVAAATAEHIKISMLGMVAVETFGDGGAEGGATNSLMVYGRDDGTNLPLAVTVNTAIS